MILVVTALVLGIWTLYVWGTCRMSLASLVFGFVYGLPNPRQSERVSGDGSQWLVALTSPPTGVVCQIPDHWSRSPRRRDWDR